MSNDSSSPETNHLAKDPAAVPWNPWLGVLFIVIVYYVAQILSGVVVSIYPSLNNWSDTQAYDWLSDSIYAQFTFILLTEVAAIGAIYLFLKRRKLGMSAIGLRKPRWMDAAYGLAAIPAYFILFILTVAAIKLLAPGLDVEQEQQIGFNNVSGPLELGLTFVSLVILPPLAEEIMVRGFLYSSLKKALSLIPAVILTSLLFAAAHLPEGGAAGPLYIAAIDTFILSLVLIYLREKTGGLWAPITLHAIKNGIAFTVLFVIGTR
jgi:membrane protease YdiL (CAAX protease family)